MTLLALLFMTRPSDLAPKAKVFDPQNRTSKAEVMTVEDVKLENDGSMTVIFWDIKNETNRQLFEVVLLPATENFMDPAECLKGYILRIRIDRKSSEYPLFMSLNTS